MARSTLGSPISAACLMVVFSILVYQSFQNFLGGIVTLSATLILLSLGSIELLILIAIYRLTLHPLARYPGPWWGAITDWYTVYHCLVRDRHIDLFRLHRDYGTIVRFGPNRISINTNTALRDIYAVNANHQKSQIYKSFQHFFKVPSSMTTIDKKVHAFERRINVRAIGNNITEDLESLMLHNIRIFCDQLLNEHPSHNGNSENAIQTGSGQENDGWSSARDMTLMIAYVTSDIMGDITFSRNWNMLQSTEHRKILEVIPRGVAGINMSGYMPAILKLKLDRILCCNLVKETYNFEALSKDRTSWRAAQSPSSLKSRDLFAALLEARDPETGHGYTQEELVSEAGLLIVAGSDTMATGVTSTMFYLLHYPTTLSRLQKEVRTAFSDVEAIRTGPKLSACTYVTACLNEAMRLTPGVGGLLPREVLSGGMVVDGHYFPEGIDIGVPHYGIHHNVEYYPEPFSFRPERWLVEGDITAADVALAQSAFCPFSIGRVSCVGKNLAYSEMSILLARMVWLYDMRLQAGSTVGEGNHTLGNGRILRNEFQVYDNFTSTHEGPMVEFRPAQK